MNPGLRLETLAEFAVRPADTEGRVVNYQSKINSDRKIWMALVSSTALDNLGHGVWRLRWVVFATVSAAIVWLSVWQGAYNLDPHHWGLMLSNAKDLRDGRLPYRDIFIQYGILTTIVHALAFDLAGQNLRALILSTSLFYAIGLIGVYYIGLAVFERRSLAFYSYMCCAVAHGICIYPWSNYIAFPFLSFGIAAVLWRERSGGLSLVGGVLLGLAILAREGLLAPVLGFAIFVTALEILEKRSLERAVRLAIFWIGLSIPVVLFVVYLLVWKLFPFWYEAAVVLPRLYYEFFSGKGLLDGPLSLVSYFRDGVRTFNVRAIFFGLVLISAGVVFARCGVYRSIREQKPALALAAMTLLLISAALHLAEVFRLVTSVAVGTVLLFYFASKLRVEGLMFWGMLAGMVVSWHSPINGNYYYPSMEQLAATSTGSRPAIFSGQRWPKEAFDYYEAFAARLTSLQDASCGLRYFHNDTKDAFLATLNPFAQYQLAPFGRAAFDDLPLWRWSRILRPDYDVDHKISVDRDIVLFQTVKPEDVETYRPPSGYVVASRRQMPRSHFFPEGNFLFVVIPEACGKAL